MIIKRNFNPVRVFHYVQKEMLTALFASVAVFLLHAYHVTDITLPFSIVAILGSALAIFIAFRNNSAYSRWWEARTLWGGIVNSSRILARLIITFTDSHAQQSNYQAERSSRFKQEMVYKTIAWAHALRIHLRRQSSWNELKPFLDEKEFEEMITKQHKPNYLHQLTGHKIYQAMSDGTLGGFDSFQMEGQLLALDNFLGGCERIKNTPLLRQYDYFTRVFLYTFILLLPHALIGDFKKLNLEWLMIPVSAILTFIFAIISKVGEVNEDPFENRITDVPLTALCNSIERDLREMLGEKELPQKMEAVEGFLF